MAEAQDSATAPVLRLEKRETANCHYEECQRRSNPASARTVQLQRAGDCFVAMLLAMTRATYPPATVGPQRTITLLELPWIVAVEIFREQAAAIAQRRPVAVGADDLAEIGPA